MCTSPITIYSCGHTKPDHIIEFCYTDYEDDCGQVHPRFERLARRCPGCTRRAHDELERRAGIPAHGPHDEDARSASSPALSRSASVSPSSSPKGEPISTSPPSPPPEAAAAKPLTTSTTSSPALLMERSGSAAAEMLAG